MRLRACVDRLLITLLLGSGIMSKAFHIFSYRERKSIFLFFFLFFFFEGGVGETFFFFFSFSLWLKSTEYGTVGSSWFVCSLVLW